MVLRRLRRAAVLIALFLTWLGCVGAGAQSSNTVGDGSIPSSKIGCHGYRGSVCL